MSVKNKLESKMEIVIKAINKTKGEDVIIYDFSSLNPFIDRVIICGANNLRQVNAIAHNIRNQCKENNYVARVEGNDDSKWILIDIDDVIIHVFLDDERDVYRLERLYGDLPRMEHQYDL